MVPHSAEGGRGMIYSLGARRVVAEGDYFVAESAAVIGAVRLRHNASVWYGAVLRGDYDAITIGEESNVQDCAIVHMDEGFPVTVGDRVTVGHQATVHGCTIGDDSLIGINAVVLSGARIGAHCLIGSNTLIAEGKEIPERSLVLGSPGRVVREVTDDEIAQIRGFADLYVNNFKRMQRELVVQDEADRP